MFGGLLKGHYPFTGVYFFSNLWSGPSLTMNVHHNLYFLLADFAEVIVPDKVYQIQKDNDQVSLNNYGLIFTIPAFEFNAVVFQFIPRYQ